MGTSPVASRLFLAVAGGHEFEDNALCGFHLLLTSKYKKLLHTMCAHAFI
jgi:hypothetical protein